MTKRFVYKPNSLDYLLLCCIGLIWGSQFLLNEFAIESYSPLMVATGRVFIGFLALAVITVLLPKKTVSIPDSIKKQPWVLYCLIAFFEAIIPCFLIPWGQQHVDSSIAAILLATVPVFTVFIAPLIVKEEQWGMAVLSSAFIGFIGVVVLVAPGIKGSWIHSISGELAILGGALSFSLSLILIKKLPDIPAPVAMRNVFLIASVPLLAATLVYDKTWNHAPSPESLAALVCLGVFCGGVAYILFNLMVKRSGPTFTSLVGYIVTFVGVLLGVIILHDPFQWNDVIAAILILTALVVARMKK